MRYLPCSEISLCTNRCGTQFIPPPEVVSLFLFTQVTPQSSQTMAWRSIVDFPSDHTWLRCWTPHCVIHGAPQPNKCFNSQSFETNKAGASRNNYILETLYPGWLTSFQPVSGIDGFRHLGLVTGYQANLAGVGCIWDGPWGYYLLVGTKSLVVLLLQRCYPSLILHIQLHYCGSDIIVQDHRSRLFKSKFKPAA